MIFKIKFAVNVFHLQIRPNEGSHLFVAQIRICMFGSKLDYSESGGKSTKNVVVLTEKVV